MIFNYTNVSENREKVLKLFNEIRSKFLGDSFTYRELMMLMSCKAEDPFKTDQETKNTIELLVKNGLIDIVSPNSSFAKFVYITDKNQQLERINQWIDSTKNELKFYELTYKKIQSEISHEKIKLKKA